MAYFMHMEWMLKCLDTEMLIGNVVHMIGGLRVDMFSALVVAQ